MLVNLGGTIHALMDWIIFGCSGGPSSFLLQALIWSFKLESISCSVGMQPRNATQLTLSSILCMLSTGLDLQFSRVNEFLFNDIDHKWRHDCQLS
jgi:hypothetical protein